MTFGEAVSQFDLGNDKLLVQEDFEGETIITLLDASSLQLIWEYNSVLEDTSYTTAFLADSLVLVQEFLDIQTNYNKILKAFDPFSGELIWTQPEVELLYLASVFVKDGVIFGQGGRHTSTSKFSYERDLTTGNLIGKPRFCGRACAFESEHVFYRDEVYEYKALRNTTVGLYRVSQHNLVTGKTIKCAAGNGYIFEVGAEEIPLQHRIRGIGSDGKNIFITVRQPEEWRRDRGKVFRNTYSLPLCNEENQNSIFDHRELVIGFENLGHQAKMLFVDRNTFIVEFEEIGELHLINLTPIENEQEQITSTVLGGVKVFSNNSLTLTPLQDIEGKVSHMQIQGDYLVTVSNYIFQVTDFRSNEIILRVGLEGNDIVQIFSTGKFIVLQTSTGINIINQPFFLDFQ